MKTKIALVSLMLLAASLWLKNPLASAEGHPTLTALHVISAAKSPQGDSNDSVKLPPVKVNDPVIVK